MKKCTGKHEHGLYIFITSSMPDVKMNLGKYLKRIVFFNYVIHTIDIFDASIKVLFGRGV
jgi:hypothetical protein